MELQISDATQSWLNIEKAKNHLKHKTVFPVCAFNRNHNFFLTSKALPDVGLNLNTSFWYLSPALCMLTIHPEYLPIACVVSKKVSIPILKNTLPVNEFAVMFPSHY